VLLLPSCGEGSGSVNGLSGGHGEYEPPDPIPNSEVKVLSADDSVGLPHVKVGHRQALNQTPVAYEPSGFFIFRTWASPTMFHMWHTALIQTKYH
jgi:hypothetical protein